MLKPNGAKALEASRRRNEVRTQSTSALVEGRAIRLPEWASSHVIAEVVTLSDEFYTIAIAGPRYGPLWRPFLAA